MNITKRHVGKVVLVKLPSSMRPKYRWIVRKRADGRFIARAPKMGTLIRNLDMKRGYEYGPERLLPKETKIHKWFSKSRRRRSRRSKSRRSSRRSRNRGKGRRLNDSERQRKKNIKKAALALGSVAAATAIGAYLDQKSDAMYQAKAMNPFLERDFRARQLQQVYPDKIRKVNVLKDGFGTQLYVNPEDYAYMSTIATNPPQGYYY